MHSGDARMSHARTQLRTAVHAAFAMAATFMGETVSTASDSPILLIVVSSAPVWYHHAYLVCSNMGPI